MPRSESSFQALTAVINRAASQVDLPLDTAADLFRAIDAYAKRQVPDAVTAERERIQALIRKELGSSVSRLVTGVLERPAADDAATDTGKMPG